MDQNANTGRYVKICGAKQARAIPADPRRTLAIADELLLYCTWSNRQHIDIEGT